MPQSYQERSPLRAATRILRREAGVITAAIILGAAAGGGLVGGVLDFIDTIEKLTREVPHHNVITGSVDESSFWDSYRQEETKRFIARECPSNQQRKETERVVFIDPVCR